MGKLEELYAQQLLWLTSTLRACLQRGQSRERYFQGPCSSKHNHAEGLSPSHSSLGKIQFMCYPCSTCLNPCCFDIPPPTGASDWQDMPQYKVPLFTAHTQVIHKGHRAETAQARTENRLSYLLLWRERTTRLERLPT